MSQTPQTSAETVDITVKIVKKSMELQTYKNKQTTMTYFNMIGMDHEGILHHLRSYQKSRFHQMKIGLTFKFSNVLKKAESFWLTSQSTLRYTQPIPLPAPQNIPQLPEQEPKPGQKRSLKDSLETNVRSTIKVKVVQVSPLKMCRDGTLPVRILGVKDASATSKVCLFSDKAETSFDRHDLLEISSVYVKQHANTKTLCLSRDSTLQFLPEDNEINIGQDDTSTFERDVDFLTESQKVAVTIPEFCKVTVYPFCNKEGCRSKGFVNGVCPLCQNEEVSLTCRSEVMFKIDDGPLKKTTLFQKELEAVVNMNIIDMDEDSIVMMLVSMLPIQFQANVSPDNKFRNISRVPADV